MEAVGPWPWKESVPEVTSWQSGCCGRLVVITMLAPLHRCTGQASRPPPVARLLLDRRAVLSLTGGRGGGRDDEESEKGDGGEHGRPRQIGPLLLQ